jgi:hypothetical protein
MQVEDQRGNGHADQNADDAYEGFCTALMLS